MDITSVLTQQPYDAVAAVSKRVDTNGVPSPVTRYVSLKRDLFLCTANERPNARIVVARMSFFVIYP
jgi:hypothetical protein